MYFGVHRTRVGWTVIRRAVNLTKATAIVTAYVTIAVVVGRTQRGLNGDV